MIYQLRFTGQPNGAGQQDVTGAGGSLRKSERFGPSRRDLENGESYVIGLPPTSRLLGDSAVVPQFCFVTRERQRFNRLFSSPPALSTVLVASLQPAAQERARRPRSQVASPAGRLLLVVRLWLGLRSLLKPSLRQTDVFELLIEGGEIGGFDCIPAGHHVGEVALNFGYRGRL
jgi:hypothetical protein